MVRDARRQMVQKETYKMQNVCVVAGARPNFVKVAPLMWAMSKAREEGLGLNYKLVYTSVEGDSTLEKTLFDDLCMTPPDVFLGVDSESLNEITGRVMGVFDRYLASTPTDVVIVVDDLASTMAVAIAAKKRGVKVAHLVAGTRSFDINMPKEVNRLVIDGLSDLLFTAGEGASSVATREGAPLSRIYMVGNILMDTLRHSRPHLRRPQALDRLCIADGTYLVLTLNRRLLIADQERLGQMLASLTEAAAGIPIVAPLRGMAREAVARSGVGGDMLHIIEPLPYLEFGYLTTHAIGIVTDSGNVAEEATFNNVPCATLSSHAEHAETVSVGTNVLVGEDARRLGDAVADMVGGRWKQGALPDRWDGRTAERIVKILLSEEA